MSALRAHVRDVLEVFEAGVDDVVLVGEPLGDAPRRRRAHAVDALERPPEFVGARIDGDGQAALHLLEADSTAHVGGLDFGLARRVV